MLVYALKPEVASSLDRMLWTTTLSFVPALPCDSPLAAETPILITDKLDTIAQDERLMNLSRKSRPVFSLREPDRSCWPR